MLTKVLDGIDILIDRIGKVVSFFLVIFVLVTVYEVVFRYILGSPTLWTNEFGIYWFAAYWAIGGSYVLNKKMHANLDLFSSKFSPKTAAIVELATCFLGLVFIFVLFYKGGEKALASIRISEHSNSVWSPSMIPYRVSLPIGAALMLLQMLAQLARRVLFLVKGVAK